MRIVPNAAGLTAVHSSALQTMTLPEARMLRIRRALRNGSANIPSPMTDFGSAF